MDHLADNPFFILELPATATPMEIERQGKMILARLELGLASALTHPSPLGPRPRSADDVRRAMQQLADPRRRLAAEPFALAGAAVLAAPAHAPGIDAVNGPAHVDGAPSRDAVVDLGTLPWWRP